MVFGPSNEMAEKSIQIINNSLIQPRRVQTIPFLKSQIGYHNSTLFGEAPYRSKVPWAGSPTLR